jgi:hypothetical protein
VVLAPATNASLNGTAVACDNTAEGDDDDDDDDDDIPPLEDVTLTEGAAAATVVVMPTVASAVARPATQSASKDQDAITGPKAADMLLFDDEDTIEVIPKAQSSVPLLQEVTMPSSANPVKAEVEELEMIRPTRLLITELSDPENDDEDDEIPEVIAASAKKKQAWFSVADQPTAAATASAAAVTGMRLAVRGGLEGSCFWLGQRRRESGR